MRAIVFGGRSPIALASAAKLAAQGFHVVLATRKVDDNFRSQISHAGIDDVIECDLARTNETVSQVASLASKGDLGCIAFLHRYRDGNEDPLRQYIVEVLTPHAVLSKVAQMDAAPASAILCLSPAARAVVLDQDFQYHASKAALQQLVRYGAVKWASHGLRVNGVAPGPYVFKERARNYYEAHPEVFERVRNVVPLERMATVDEVANVVAFLASSESSYVNGQTIEVDGGVNAIDLGTFRWD